MTKGTVILMGGIWAMLAGQSAFALASAAPASARSPMGEALVGMTCPCDGDMDGSGTIQIIDVLFVIDCVNGVEPEPPQTCDAADVDCDGVWIKAQLNGYVRSSPNTGQPARFPPST